MNSVEIPPNRRVIAGRLSIVLLGAVGTTGLFIALLNRSVALSAAIGAIILAAAGWRLMYLLFTRVALVLDQDGIIDHTTPLGRIQWHEVGSVRIRNSVGMARMDIVLADPERWIKSLPWWRRGLWRGNIRIGLLPSVVLSLVDAELDQMQELIDKSVVRHRVETPNQREDSDEE